MRRIFHIAATVAVLVLGLSVTSAHAQAVRTFVSGHGTDSGICGVGAPCRTFAFALTQTNAGGEIVVLDSAGYGIVTINKALSITNEEGVEAAITTATASNAVTVAAGPSDVVNLSGLTLTGGGVGTNGITFTSGGTLNIQNCVTRGFTNDGLFLTPGASSQFNVADTIVSNNGLDGIVVAPTGTGTTTGAFFERVEAIGNNYGFYVSGSASTGTLQATATNSAANGNGAGFWVVSSTGQAVTTFTIVNSTAANNGDGLVSTAGGVTTATMFVGGTTVSGNANGFFITSGGVIKTFGNNNITDTTNIGTLTPINQQ